MGATCYSSDCSSSDLFRDQLAAPWLAARRHWRLAEHEPVDWEVARLEAPASAVRRALASRDRAYLLIVNSPAECVVGGQADEVQAVAAAVGCARHPVSGATSVHCPIARSVIEAYRSLHRLPTAAPESIRFYRACEGDAYRPTTESAAHAITALALDTIDFPRVIEAAYADGARVFVESGPGRSIGRMLGEILGPRAHASVGVCPNAHQELRSLLETLGALAAHGVDVRLDPLLPSPAPAAAARRQVTVQAPGAGFEPPAAAPPPSAPTSSPSTPEIAAALSPVLAQMQATQAAGAQVHRTFLDLNQELSESYARTLAFRHRVLAQAGPEGRPAPVMREIGELKSPEQQQWRSEDRRARCTGEPVTIDAPGTALPRALDREQCLEFAVGRIGAVFGPRFADVDAYPTRVRLPDEPLMLVDHVLEIEGDPDVLGPGRIVTEHDVHADRWYLDGGRIPTSIAVEAGQADLMLSAFLGIDHRTGGLAVYRLLDAEIAFDAPLPGPDTTIRYDIRIEHFFRQGQTHLFRFRFDATVDGERFLTMRNGCAGFFTPAELAGGQGLVGGASPAPGSIQAPPPDCSLVPMRRERYDEAALERLRAGDLGGCFGPRFDRLALDRPMGLPSGRLTLVHRIVDLDPAGGYGLGRVVGEADIHPDDWFLSCHFADDEVMPGTLMYECCLQTLRVFLLRMGWVGEVADAGFEPVPGVASSLKCRGQVTPTTRRVRYEILLTRLGFDEHTGTPYAIADAIMHADGRPIVLMRNMSARARGLTREGLLRHLVGAPSRRTRLVHRAMRASARHLRRGEHPRIRHRQPVRCLRSALPAIRP